MPDYVRFPRIPMSDIIGGPVPVPAMQGPPPMGQLMAGQDSPGTRLEMWYNNVWRPIAEAQGIPEGGLRGPTQGASIPSPAPGPQTPSDQFHGLQPYDARPMTEQASGIASQIARGRMTPLQEQQGISMGQLGMTGVQAQQQAAEAAAQYAGQGQAFGEAFQAGVPPTQFNVSDATTLADYAKAKQAEQSAANAGATPEFLRQMNQGVWHGSTGTDLGDRTKREASQARRADVLAERRENVRRARLRPDLRAQEVMDEETSRQERQFKAQVAAEQQVALFQALGTGMAGIGQGQGDVSGVMDFIERMSPVPTPSDGDTDGDLFQKSQPAPKTPKAPTTYDIEYMGIVGEDTNPDNLAGISELIRSKIREGTFEKERSQITTFLSQGRHRNQWKKWLDSPNVFRDVVKNPMEGLKDTNQLRKALGLPLKTFKEYKDSLGPVDRFVETQGLFKNDLWGNNAPDTYTGIAPNDKM